MSSLNKLSENNTLLALPRGPEKTIYTTTLRIDAPFGIWKLENPICATNKSKDFEPERLSVDLRLPESALYSRYRSTSNVEALGSAFQKLNHPQFNNLAESRSALSHITRSVKMIETLHGKNIPPIGGTQLIYGNNGYMTTFEPLFKGGY